METPNYYAIIPASVRYDKNLKANEKLLYGEITALCGKDGCCWATNEYFASLYSVSKKQVSLWINNLIQQGYLKSKILYKENTRQIDKRILSIKPINEKVNTYEPKGVDPINEKVNTPIHQKVKENNTRYEYYKNNNISVDNFSDNEILEDFSELEDLDKIEEEVIIEEKQIVKKVKQIDNDFLEFAKGLKSYVENKKRIKVSNSQLENWAKEIYKLYKQKLSCDTEEQAKERIKQAIQFLIDYGETDKYYPVVESGRSFYEKFERVENAMARQKSKNFCSINFADLGWDLVKKKGEKNDK